MTAAANNAPETDAGGYMGDWTRGAPLGRQPTGDDVVVTNKAPPFSLRLAVLDGGGYDEGGAYWGIGEKGRQELFYFSSHDGAVTGYVRAEGAWVGAAERRQKAEEAVLELHPKARFEPGNDAAFEDFFEGMIQAALFSSPDNNEDENDNSSFLDHDATLADIAEETRVSLYQDAEKFFAAHGALFVDANFTGRLGGSTVAAHAGHDFWLTRCGHGAGFWDGDWADEVEETLTDAARDFGDVDLYRGDDDLIYR